jgi:hypothetical protein
MIKKILKYFFSSYTLSQYKWYRREIGGYWEYWKHHVSVPDLWYRVDSPYEKYRPGCAAGTPYCEYYPYNFEGYKTEWENNNKNIIRSSKLKRILNGC